MGPGRPRCGAVAQGACEQAVPYDGYALPRVWFPPGSNSVTLEVHAYGQHQPTMHVTQRILLQLVVHLRNGTVLTLGTGGGHWEAFDATCDACSLYRPDGNSGGRFGAGYWYFYPHENPDARCLPTQLGSHGWQTAAVVDAAPFTVRLTPKPVSPVSLSSVAISGSPLLKRLDPTRFAFALPTEIQGGIRIGLVTPQSEHGGRTKRAQIQKAQVMTTINATVRLSEQLNADGSVRIPMYTGATFVSNFTLVAGADNVSAEHHEYMNWRFGEVEFSEPIAESAFTLSAWVVHYPFNDATASEFDSNSPSLNRVWRLNRNSVKYLGLDMYSDSNARQRSNACQADATTACQAQVATSDELAMPRYMTEMIMDFSHVPDSTSWPFPPPAPGSAAAKANGTGGYVSHVG
eukprot:m.638946 g.638946  ORF g.638946 m.638946 type:complete len:405 (-) comp22609_c0_seq5:1597-2811(-)